MGSAFSKKRRRVSASDAEQSNKPIRVQSNLSLPIANKKEQVENEKQNWNQNSCNLIRNKTVSPQPHDPKQLPSSGVHELKTSDVGSSNVVHNTNSIPSKIDEDGNVIEDDSWWTATELYNVLVAESWLGKPQLLDLDYLLLLDCRNYEEYQKSHIITAKHHTSLETGYGCLLSVPGQLESFSMIVIYNDDNGHISKMLQSRQIDFNILNLSYQVFENKYPFLCTDVIVNSTEQRNSCLKTWPSEICNGQIYQGTGKHASDESIIQSLGITHIINVTLDQPNSFPDSVKYMRIQLDDEKNVDLLSWLPKTTRFVSEALHVDSGSTSDLVSTGDVKRNSNRVLIHCNMGRSRSSTVMLAYLMEVKKWSLKDACDWLKECRPTVKPNVGFLNQLLLYNEKLLGRKVSEFTELPF